MKKITVAQIQDLEHLVREYVILIDLLDSSPELKVILGPMMDDLGENDPEMAFGGLDLDRHQAKKLLTAIEGWSSVQDSESK